MSGRTTLSVPQRPAGPPVSTSARSHAWLRGLSIAATATTFLLIAIGGLVRATGSGLGCSGWPKCTTDRWLPPLEYHSIIEYSHRFTAFIDIVLVLMLAVVAWLRYSRVRRVNAPATAAIFLVLFQAVLGGIVVKGELHAFLVSAHLATAMVFAGVLIYLTVASFTMGAKASTSAQGLTRLARVAAAATLALIAVGAYVRGEGAGLVFPDWPLMDGRLVPGISSAPAGVHFAHRVLALAAGVLVVVVAARARRERPRRAPVNVLATGAALLFMVQVLIGATNVWSKLAPAAVVAHVAVASLTWGAVVATAATSSVVPGEVVRAGERGEESP
ncbi:MAG TPA: COX15/CtaA family protein [Actinomycetota bacterium]|nr:COX15/CtaA family protein [Actinomycetota bacterium]